MVKNNLKALLVHVVISIIAWVVYSRFGGFASAKRATEEAADNHHMLLFRVTIGIIIVAVILYYLAGWLLMINQGNILKNLLATIIISGIGVFLWAIAFIIDYVVKGDHSLSSELWSYYGVYNSYATFYFYEAGINNPFIWLLPSFVPSAVMALGMLTRKRSKEY